MSITARKVYFIPHPYHTPLRQFLRPSFNPGCNAPQGCIKLVISARTCFITPGKDAFHRVPLWAESIGDRVESVPTCQNGELDAALNAPTPPGFFL
jgi:hypothetical protein